MKTGNDIDVKAVQRILAALDFEATEVSNPAPTCRCIARWKNADGQDMVLKIEWMQGDPLATPENVAGLLKYYAYKAVPPFSTTRWVPPEATIFLCKQLLEEIP